MGLDVTPLVIDPERAAWVPGRRKFFLMGLAFALAPSLRAQGWAPFPNATHIRFTVPQPISVRFVEQWIMPDTETRLDHLIGAHVQEWAKATSEP